MFLTAADAITSTAVTGTITTTGSLSAVAGADTAGAGGEVLIRHTNAVANKAITLNAAIVASGGAAVEAGDTGGAGAVVTILNDSGNISVHNITADGGAPGGGTAGVGGTIQLKTGVTGNTIGLAAGIYLIFGLVTWYAAALPWWLVMAAGGCLVCLHGSLQHEVVHGFPTRRRWLNVALIYPSLWLFVPYGLYCDSHLRHHHDERLTTPDEDPESWYVSAAQWAQMGPFHRLLDAVSRPFDERPGLEAYAGPAPAGGAPHVTYCGT